MSVIPPIQSFDEFEAATVAFLKPPRETRFGRLSYREIRKLERVPPDWVVRGWMVAGEISFLAGAPQSGKSFLATHAALCVAAGHPIFGMRVKQGLVIYIAAESSTGVTRQRIPAWQEHYGKEIDDLPFEIFTTKIDLFRPDGDADAIIDAIKKIQAEWGGMPVRLVVIDTLSKVMPGASEIDGKDVGRVLDNFDKIAKQTGAHVMSPAHPAKGGKGVRGHGSLLGNVDSSAQLVEDQNTKIRTLSFEKVKEGPKDERFQFELMWLPLGAEEDGKPFGSCVCVPLGEKEAIRRDEQQKGFTLNQNEIILMKAFFAADGRYGKPVPAEMTGVPSHVRSVVEWSSVLAEYASLNPIDEDMNGFTEDQIAAVKGKHKEMHKKRVKRAREYLQKAGVLGIADPHAWFTGKPLRAFPQTQPRPSEPEGPSIQETLSPEDRQSLSQIPF